MCVWGFGFIGVFCFKKSKGFFFVFINCFLGIQTGEKYCFYNVTWDVQLFVLSKSYHFFFGKNN